MLNDKLNDVNECQDDLQASISENVERILNAVNDIRTGRSVERQSHMSGSMSESLCVCCQNLKCVKCVNVANVKNFIVKDICYVWKNGSGQLAYVVDERSKDVNNGSVNGNESEYMERNMNVESLDNWEDKVNDMSDRLIIDGLCTSGSGIDEKRVNKNFDVEKDLDVRYEDIDCNGLGMDDAVNEIGDESEGIQINKGKNDLDMMLEGMRINEDSANEDDNKEDSKVDDNERENNQVANDCNVSINEMNGYDRNYECRMTGILNFDERMINNNVGIRNEAYLIAINGDKVKVFCNFKGYKNQIISYSVSFKRKGKKNSVWYGFRGRAYNCSLFVIPSTIFFYWVNEDLL